MKSPSVSTVRTAEAVAGLVPGTKKVPSSSLLVRDNMKSPPLALLQPRASPRAEGKETVEIAYNGPQKVNAVEEISVE